MSPSVVVHFRVPQGVESTYLLGQQGRRDLLIKNELNFHFHVKE